MTQTPRLCPICRRPSQEATRPFCSRRCADIDLGRWFSGSYRVPTDEEERPAEDAHDAPG